MQKNILISDTRYIISSKSNIINTRFYKSLRERRAGCVQCEVRVRFDRYFVSVLCTEFSLSLVAHISIKLLYMEMIRASKIPKLTCRPSYIIDVAWNTNWVWSARDAANHTAHCVVYRRTNDRPTNQPNEEEKCVSPFVPLCMWLHSVALWPFGIFNSFTIHFRSQSKMFSYTHKKCTLLSQ